MEAQGNLVLGPTAAAHAAAPAAAPANAMLSQFAGVAGAFQARAGQALAGAADATMRQCAVCQTRMLRMVAKECKECSQPCCQTCMTNVRLWNPTGEASLSHSGPSVNVCNTCVGAARQRIRKANVKERMSRTVAFLEGRLVPYKYSAESKVEQSFRIGGHVLHGLKDVAGYIPVAGTAIKAINAGHYMLRYGPLVLIGNDVAMALQLLVGLATKLNLLPVLKATPQDFFGGLYYMMGDHVGERGRSPELEYLEHVDRTGSVPAPSRELLLRLRHLVRLLFCTTMMEDPSPTDAQRLFKQVLPGSELVLGELSMTREIPAYFLVCTRQDKQAYLVLPGTRGAADIATDVNAEDEELLHGSGHKGMVAGARWLLGEVGPIMIHLYTQGFSVKIVGHSLGAGIGALLTTMLRPQIASLFCYGFGTPACVDERLMSATIDCMVSVVNRDDLVPRLTVQNVESLCQSVLCPGQVAKTKAWMDEDFAAVQDYKRILELRRREDAADPLVSHDEMTDDSPSNHDKVQLLVDAGLSTAAARRALDMEGGNLDLALLRGTEEEVQKTSSGKLDAIPEVAPAGEAASSGAAGQSTAATVEQGARSFLGSLAALGSQAATHVQAFSAEAATQVQRGTSASLVSAYSSQVDGAVVGSQHHVRFFIPGQVIHIYNKNGLGRAALAAGTDDIFARINVCPNMISDHKVAAYDAALRQACLLDATAPTWESFEDRAMCACCGADFNWAYVLQSDPQRMLARHHCFKCGRVVCEGCSRSRCSWPLIGQVSAVRTCDGCVFSPEND